MTVPPSRRPRRLFLPTTAGYHRSWLRYDIVAGLTTGAVVIPQAMAYASIANLPAEVGIYTCIVPMLVYAVLGGSAAMSVSTTSTIATLTATTFVAAGVAHGAEDALGSLVTLSLMVGLVLLGIRALRLGALIENINVATILGVKIGVGGTVAVAQIPILLGEDVRSAGEGFFRAVLATGRALETAHLPTIAIGVASIAIIVFCKRYLPRVPGTFLVACAGIAVVGSAGVDGTGVALIHPVPQGLPAFTLPDTSQLVGLVPGALAIAIMAFLESATVARSVQAADAPPTDAGRELQATGAANCAGAFFLAMPAAGGLSQSAVNYAAGAKTQISSLVTAGLAILAATALAPTISLLPQATLAAMVFVAVVGLIDIPTLIRWARLSPVDFWIALLVAGVGLTAGLLPAVAVGVALTLLLVLREINSAHIDVLGKRDGVLAVRLAYGLYTANVRANTDAILGIIAAETTPVRVVAIDAHQLRFLSVTVLTSFEELDQELRRSGVTMHLAALPEQARVRAVHSEWFRSLTHQQRVHTSIASVLPE